ncbi:hypothetical protein [Mycobacterium hubeiense]|uniref:hypothetical protein n=1 Tax=Mycobacterium hubeiense TaxID=1867256 RepID=UPI000C7ED1B2|nr:hypothetical protein [Mycobacterium sp. QGD 101]
MSSILVSERDVVVETLDRLDAAYKELDALTLHTLSRVELQEVMGRLNAGEKRLAAVQRRLLGRLLSDSSPRRFDATEMLSRRLRISPAEARKRIADAGCSAPRVRPSASASTPESSA